jgi:L-ascorbate metabolism protein UlaG (beta-lactamase superfamily)
MAHCGSKLLTAVALAVLASTASGRPFSDPRGEHDEAIENAAAGEPRDQACHARTLVATGGAAPRGASTLAVRWAGQTNYELAWNGRVILLDAWYDRGSIYPPIGFKAADVRRADAILIGHGHFDHMADAASVGARTGATVVGAPVTTEKLATQAIDPKLVKTVTGKGGELLKFNGFTVEPVLGRHGQPDRHMTEVMEGAVNSIAPKPSAEQEKEFAAIRARGTSDRRVIDEGTIVYIITLENGFRILYRDSGGVVTDYEKAAMARIGRVDLAVVAVSAEFLHTLSAERAVEHMRAYNPVVQMPAHHDAPTTGHVPLWRATEPLFQAMKEANPDIVTVSKGFREPTCFNTEFNVQRRK